MWPWDPCKMFVEGSVEKPVKPGSFKKGADPRRHPPELAGKGTKKNRPLPEYVTLPDDGASPQLQDMRHVYMNVEGHDKTEGQRTQRAFKDGSPTAFQNAMTALEREHRLSSGGSGPGAADVGTRECLELLDTLIGDLTGG